MTSSKRSVKEMRRARGGGKEEPARDETYSRKACAQTLGLRGCAGRPNNVHTVHIARYDFLCAGNIACAQNKTVCARASGALLGHMDGGLIHYIVSRGRRRGVLLRAHWPDAAIVFHVHEPHKKLS